MSKTDLFVAITIIALVWIACRGDHQSIGESVTVEWAPFTISAGVEETALIDASNELQSLFLTKQSGFIRRELLKGKDNQWVDIVYWRSRDDAEQASRNARTSPICRKYFNLMVQHDANDPDAGVFHFDLVKTYQ